MQLIYAIMQDSCIWENLKHFSSYIFLSTVCKFRKKKKSTSGCHCSLVCYKEFLSGTEWATFLVLNSSRYFSISGIFHILFQWQSWEFQHSFCSVIRCSSFSYLFNLNSEFPRFQISFWCKILPIRLLTSTPNLNTKLGMGFDWISSCSLDLFFSF